MNKTELKAKLDKLEIEYPAKATNKELEALLPPVAKAPIAKDEDKGKGPRETPETRAERKIREDPKLRAEVKEQLLKEGREEIEKKKEAAKIETEEKRIKTEEEEEARKNRIKEMRVFSPTGNFVRAYTAKQSDLKDVKDGQTFIAKAHGYAKKINGTVRVVYKTEEELKAEAEAET